RPDAQGRAHPEGGRPTVVILAGLGEVLTREGRALEAEPLVREALALSSEVVPAGHWRHGGLAGVAGACLWRVGKRDEARALLVSGRDLLVASLGPAHPITRRAQRRLDAVREREAPAPALRSISISGSSRAAGAGAASDADGAASSPISACAAWRSSASRGSRPRPCRRTHARSTGST